MKKVLMSIAVVAMVAMVASCGNKNAKKGEAEAPVEEEVVEEAAPAAADSVAAPADSVAAADSTK